MCGIAGWFNLNIHPQQHTQTLAEMCDVIQHRGPDDFGYYTNNHVALGMRRLSIIDLSGGQQPKYSKDKNIALVFNGEIYNHHELREELGAQHFESLSDTEVILRYYEREGIDCLHRLNGMYAIAIWDNKQGKLHLIRDRLGIKPLYYMPVDEGLYFGSEIKSILKVLPHRPALNQRAMWDYMTFRYVPGPESIWEGIFKLAPGHRLEISLNDQAVRTIRYWDIPYQCPSESSPLDVQLEEFSALMKDSVDLRMMADVPVGITLSGGLDSSVVTALATSNAKHKIKTFSVAFENSDINDETPYAREVAKYLETEHHEVFISQHDFCEYLPEFVYYSDEPLADLASVPLYYVCRLASKHVKVALSGEGSDEILAGYSFDRVAHQFDQALRNQSFTGRLRKKLGLGYQELPPVDIRDWPIPLHMTNLLSSAHKQKLFKGITYPDSMNGLREALTRLGDQHPLHQALYLYCQHWLVEDLLMKADRMSMANSLELRTPFLDYRLVEWAARQNPEIKAGPNKRGEYESKIILKRLASGLIPDGIINRPKKGFPVPVYDWLSGPLRSLVNDLLGQSSTMLRDYCSRKMIDAMIQTGTHVDAQSADRHILWNLLILELWLNRWVK